ncbi:MAG TPA: four helix bundle protein [Saprospiraceae bacterium]|nr:four helix bundle protein [Saprospiraceae bacterium]
MHKSDGFEDLIVWREAIKLAKDIFSLYENCKNFSLKNQIERSAISISSNIAEGYELDTNRQFIKYLFIAKASCGEVRSQLLLSREIQLFPQDKLTPLIESARKLSVMIYKLIQERRKRK